MPEFMTNQEYETLLESRLETIKNTPNGFTRVDLLIELLFACQHATELDIDVSHIMNDLWKIKKEVYKHSFFHYQEYIQLYKAHHNLK